MKNLLTDIAGVRVGHADDAALGSGVTAVVFDQPVVTAIDIRGGGPGTREAGALQLENTVERIDAIALSGGSAFGLGAAPSPPVRDGVRLLAAAVAREVVALSGG